MSNFPSPVGTTNPATPVVPPTQIGRFAGLKMHFPILTDGAGDSNSSSLMSAVLLERANITATTPTWSANQPMTVATEPFGCERVWTIGASASLSHARKVLVRVGLVVTLAADTNAVTSVASGATPTGGVAGDLAIDYAGNAYWLNVAGTWTSQGAIYSYADAATTAAALAARIAAKAGYTLGAGSNAWVFGTMGNAIGASAQASASTLVMNTTGASEGDSACFVNTGAGTVTVTNAQTNSKTTNVVQQYDIWNGQFSGGAWVSGMPNSVATSTPFTLTASVLNASPSTLTLALSESAWQGPLPAVGTLTLTKNGSAFNPTAWAFGSAGVINGTLPSAIISTDTLLLSYTENTTARIVNLLGGKVLQTFSAISVVNSVAAAAPIFTTQTAPTTVNVGSPYNATYAASGTSGASPYSIGSGALPTGATINPATGVISGAVTAAGTFTFRVAAAGPGGTSTLATAVTVVSTAVGITDSFTGADGTALAGRTTDTGSAVWFAGEEQTVTTPGNAQIQSNRACSAESFKQANQYIAAPSANVTVAADCLGGEVHHGHIGGSGTANHTYVALKIDTSGNVTAYRRYKGTNTTLLTQAFSAGAHRLSITATGMNTATPLYDFKVDGVSMTGSPLNAWSGQTGTQGANLGDGADVYHGFLAYNTGAYVDNFSAV